MLPFTPLALIALVAGVLYGLLALTLWRLLRRRLQGFTGDGLGATQQVGEVMFYVGAVFALGVTS